MEGIATSQTGKEKRKKKRTEAGQWRNKKRGAGGCRAVKASNRLRRILDGGKGKKVVPRDRNGCIVVRNARKGAWVVRQPSP